MEKLNENLILFYERLNSWETEVVKDSGITLAQMHTIEIIGIYEPLIMKELANKLSVVMGTLTVMIKRLESMGLVLRKRNPDDLRSYQITLTEKGFEHYQDHHNHHLMLAQEISLQLTKEEEELFNKLISKIIKHL